MYTTYLYRCLPIDFFLKTKHRGNFAPITPTGVARGGGPGGLDKKRGREREEKKGGSDR